MKLAFSLVVAPLVALAAEPFVLNGDAAKGKDPFTLLCISCHGEKGKGDGVAAKAVLLDPKPTSFADPANAARLTEEWVYQVIKDGGPSHGKSALMVSWSGSLTDQQIRDVAAYVLTFKPAAKAPKKK